MSGEDVEKAWIELKEGIVGAASRVNGIVRMKRRGEKRSRWWNDVRELVRKKKLMYRRLLDTGTEDARRHYNEAKIEAKRVVRRAKNEEWVQLERELEKDAWGDQRRFWARVNGSKEARDRMQQICSSDGRVLVGVEVRDRWKEHFEGLYGAADRSGNQKLYREATLESEPEIVKEEVRIGRGVRMLMGRKVAVCGVSCWRC